MFTYSPNRIMEYVCPVHKTPTEIVNYSTITPVLTWVMSCSDTLEIRGTGVEFTMYSKRSSRAKWWSLAPGQYSEYLDLFRSECAPDNLPLGKWDHTIMHGGGVFQTNTPEEAVVFMLGNMSRTSEKDRPSLDEIYKLMNGLKFEDVIMRL